MANTFKKAIKSSVTNNAITHADAVVHTGSNDTVIIGLTVSNKISSGVTIDVAYEDVSASSTVFILKDAPVPVGGGQVPVGGDQKVVLETGDKLRVRASQASACDAIVSYLEIS
jgi:hypothetical protein|tara:strand:+ start:458 stop:799 length:342 start_codon:yes stop_codon:yes gene_type:complete